MMYDNGLTFLAEVVQDAAAYLDFRTFAVAPYSPHQNGKVERCHQTISRLALSEIAAWDHGPRNKAGKLYDYTPISEGELISRVAEAVRVYNFERPHSGIAGCTRWEAFAADSAPLRLETPE
ncbi:MAG: transposase, partial [Solirubrobacterales bacterium]|nr:transposase [Solirubrobacterales bacterium]